MRQGKINFHITENISIVSETFIVCLCDDEVVLSVQVLGTCRCPRFYSLYQVSGPLFTPGVDSRRIPFYLAVYSWF